MPRINPLTGAEIVEMAGYDSQNISAAGTYVLATGAGVLRKILINKPISLGIITAYNNTAASGTKLATITNPLTLLQQQQELDYNSKFTTGLTVTTSLADDITVVYSQ